MKNIRPYLWLSPIACWLMLAGCSSTPEGDFTRQGVYEEGVPGGTLIETFTVSTTVTGIDKANRKVTLVSQAGRKRTYTAGPDVVNFDQIQVGDQLTVTAAEELEVYLNPPGAATADSATGLVALTPKGAKPGGILASTVQVTTKVKSLDPKRHKVTLEYPDGTTRTVAVRKDVDLTRRKAGEEVVIRSTEALMIRVDKP